MSRYDKITKCGKCKSRDLVVQPVRHAVAFLHFDIEGNKHNSKVHVTVEALVCQVCGIYYTDDAAGKVMDAAAHNARREIDEAIRINHRLQQG